ncbi:MULTISPECIES: DegT/DnrJ/EryC1/StrS family aminotransferase [Acinetobacter]|jgi:dTDP-4-amino-4,6-dideoxygalactose transaminase|uniref:DegT/DnrJ/EryC1/StrS family aminotransferase n=1 Tax=Acinetobacter haemolyticus TaxID=29430 RepID=A0A6L9E665_ACIHA|nr:MULTISPECIES: DegT/DnrJ/EryC1/StrS family aminotransferase [Acinetobacter]EJB8578617.1 DegT/DnrJ/EryC1/StrS family aminotransferase [Acinetobacter baumannii]MCU4613592.1 DegT/DnrJ/EryC1/StrS family aminotransferase [Acinetobacter parvus]NAR51526.1 DegT/DnrJ/EryC1/StrS family aminotransferase [Acinetobacter haemolyticus]NAR55553.1 DegT/DnrJ/EryC1/StrS family aminotransferase [Acinetobacter haemolyticus]NAR57020.1 DegT/DnrJ/EryC1/StrS family aminotransferase [Acinetobacter haemolyticus]
MNTLQKDYSSSIIDDYKSFYKTPTVSLELPHEIWPPNGNDSELLDIGNQRNLDIRIAGKSGPIKVFEDSFLSFLENKVKYGITFNSGTSALLASYFSLDLTEGDEVIGPVLTYHAALSPLFLLRLKPVLADVQQTTRCIDPLDIERKITEKTKAITVVHQWGHPADLDAIIKLCEKYNLKLVEDCSHAHGSKYKGKLCGTFGDVAAFSLQANKMIYAGEGGILVTNNEDIHDKATLLGHYRDRSKNEIKNAELQKYWVTGFGQKLRMSPFNAIVAKYSLNNFEKNMSGRHACLNYFNKKLSAFDFIEPHFVDDSVDMGAWYGFKPLYHSDKLNNIDKSIFIKLLQMEGLEISDPSAPLLSTTPLYNNGLNPLFNIPQESNSYDGFINADYISKSGLSLPTFYEPDIHIPLIDKYIEAIEKVSNFLKSY